MFIAVPGIASYFLQFYLAVI